MTIAKPLYQEPHEEKDPGYIDPKEMQDIFKALPVSEMVKINPGAYEYMMQKYYQYLHSPGDTSLSFKDFVRDYFNQNLDELKKDVEQKHRIDTMKMFTQGDK